VGILLITEDFLRILIEGENFEDLNTDRKNFKIGVVETENVGYLKIGPNIVFK
jgi:hypothetical protein